MEITPENFGQLEGIEVSQNFKIWRNLKTQGDLKGMRQIKVKFKKAKSIRVIRQ
jgi:hypothetical protein